MPAKDHRAIYIHCDGSMMPNSKSSGGIGYVIKFPEEFEIDNISDYEGTFEDANIERLEILGIIKGMDGFMKWHNKNPIDLSSVSQIVLITDRYDLNDKERTSPFRIQGWRRCGGKNHEGKEILNWDLLNKLDKTRTKLRNQTWKSVRIEYRRRKENKEADKLSKKGRKAGIPTREIAIEGHKIGRRKFSGQEINYKNLVLKESMEIHIFRKRPIKEQWEINAEVISGGEIGRRIKIITDYRLQEKLMRGHYFKVRLKTVHTFHVEIYRTIKKIRNAPVETN